MKEFDFGETKASVAQINIMGRQQGLDKMPELLAALEAMRETEGFDLSFLMVTDILSEATDLLVAGVNQAKVTEPSANRKQKAITTCRAYSPAKNRLYRL